MDIAIIIVWFTSVYVCIFVYVHLAISWSLILVCSYITTPYTIMHNAPMMYESAVSIISY